MDLEMQLPKIDEKCETLPVNGRHGLCRAYYQPDLLDYKTIEFAQTLSRNTTQQLYALDLGCSPYFPQSQRLAKLGFMVDAFDIEKPSDKILQNIPQYQNCINYCVKNLADITTRDLRDDYQIVYANRCLSFLSYPQTRRLLHILINHLHSKTRYFLAFFMESAIYAQNYPIHLPLEERFVTLENPVARGNDMLAPACVYQYHEIFENLLGDLPITIIEEIKAESGSLKIIFENLR